MWFLCDLKKKPFLQGPNMGMGPYGLSQYPTMALRSLPSQVADEAPGSVGTPTPSSVSWCGELLEEIMPRRAPSWVFLCLEDWKASNLCFFCLERMLRIWPQFGWLPQHSCWWKVFEGSLWPVVINHANGKSSAKAIEPPFIHIWPVVIKPSLK